MKKIIEYIIDHRNENYMFNHVYITLQYNPDKAEDIILDVIKNLAESQKKIEDMYHDHMHHCTSKYSIITGKKL